MYITAKKMFLETQEKVTFLIIGLPSTLAKAINENNDIKDYIEEVIWMGGAINVMGNVPISPYAEFNAFWDPPSVKSLIESGFQLN